MSDESQNTTIITGDHVMSYLRNLMYAAVRSAIEDARDLPRGMSVEQYNNTQLAEQLAVQKQAEIDAETETKEEPPQQEKPKKKRAPRKKKAEPVVEAPEEKEEPTEEPTETGEYDEKDAFIAAIKQNASKPSEAKKVLKSLIGVENFVDCPLDRRAEFIEALKNA